MADYTDLQKSDVRARIKITPWSGNVNAGRKKEMRFDCELIDRHILKPCPFCGGTANIANTWTASYWVECDGCGAQVHGAFVGREWSEAGHAKAAISAIIAWNRRQSQEPSDG